MKRLVATAACLSVALSVANAAYALASLDVTALNAFERTYFQLVAVWLLVLAEWVDHLAERSHARREALAAATLRDSMEGRR